MPTPRRSILLVEDDGEVRQLFRLALVADGFEVREAVDGMEALRRIDAQPPDLIVLDLGLPGFDGFAVLEDLANDPRNRRIPVVVVTASPEPLAGIRAACILRKPVTPEAVVTTVHRCIESA